MKFKILDVFLQDCYLIVRAEHYHPDGLVWFTEYYRWQGREGLKQKKATVAGLFLMDNGLPAPFSIQNNGLSLQQYLPVGRSWKRLPPPRLDKESILDVIRGIHTKRLAEGWPGGEDTLSPSPYQPADTTGSKILLTKFVGLKGTQE